LPTVTNAIEPTAHGTKHLVFSTYSLFQIIVGNISIPTLSPSPRTRTATTILLFL